METRDALVLFWSKSGNTEKVAESIFEALRTEGLTADMKRIEAELETDFLAYKLVFLGFPVYSNLPPKPVIDFLRGRSHGAEASAPEIPGHAAVMFCTYGGGHTGYNEADPALKYAGQSFEHEGIRVVDYWAVVGSFPDAGDPAYNTRGRLGDISGRPSLQDLEETAGRTRGVVRRLRYVLGFEPR